MRTSAKRSSLVTSSGTLMAATLPVTPSSTWGRVPGLWVGMKGQCVVTTACQHVKERLDDALWKHNDGA